MTDLFTVEDSVADQVAHFVTLSEEDRQRLVKRSTENAAAYHVYLN